MRYLATLILVLSSFVAFSQIPSYVPYDGLVGWWPFDGNANDMSGNGYDGTVFGATLTTDRFDNPDMAYDFSGITQYITTQYPGIMGTTSRSISAWVKTIDSTFYGGVVSYGYSTDGFGSGVRFNCNLRNDVTAEGVNLDIGGATITWAAPMTSNEWHFYTWVFDNSISSSIYDIKIYVDGVLATVIDAAYVPSPSYETINTLSGNNVRFGSNYTNTPFPMFGKIDDIGLWNRALSEEEILALFLAENEFTCNFSFNLGPDTALCENEILVLDASVFGDYNYTWQNNSHSSTFNVSAAGTYYCEVSNLDSNLILNGDFELGNTSFSSDYDLGAGGTWGQLSNAGTYAVDTSPSNVHNNFAVCSDHTSGSGNMMICNGSTVQNSVIWTQTIDVEPNTDYQISTWIISVVSDNPAQLNFSINSVNVGATFSPSATTCNWLQFNELWNSGSSTSAVISITNQNISGGGNDFALDDISFNPYCSVTDSITVSYLTTPGVDLGPDLMLCGDETVTLDVTFPGASYMWQDGTTEATFLVNQSGIYWSEVMLGECSISDSINVNIGAFPVVDLGPDLQPCEDEIVMLDVSLPGGNYLWQNGTTASSFSVNASGIYWSQVTVDQCTSADSISVTFIPLPEVDLGMDTTICENEILLLNAELENASYQWQDGSTNASFNVEQGGLYWVELTIGLCSNSDSVVVDLTPLPFVELGTDSTICEDEVLMLNAELENADYLWQDGSINASYVVDQTGLYWVEVTLDQCSKRDSIFVSLFPLPMVDLGPDDSFCENEGPVLNVLIPGASYEWQDGSENSEYSVSQTGLYWAEVTLGQCASRDSVFLSLLPLPVIDLGPDIVLCENEEITLSVSTPGGIYEWQDGSQNSEYTVEETGLYWAEVTVGQCANSDEVMVYFTPLPNVHLGLDTIICDEDVLILNGSVPNGSYIWQDGSEESVFSVNQPGIYWIEVWADECSKRDSIFVEMMDCTISLEIPNIFTPNFDGKNDFFTPAYSAGIASMNTLIYNRWGKLVFESKDPSIIWRGDDASDGTYFWIINYTGVNKQHYSEQGYITLLR